MEEHPFLYSHSDDESIRKSSIVYDIEKSLREISSFSVKENLFDVVINEF